MLKIPLRAGTVWQKDKELAVISPDISCAFDLWDAAVPNPQHTCRDARSPPSRMQRPKKVFSQGKKPASQD